jgi:hypothetical protein
MQEVKPTWKLAWGLWWRMVLIGLALYVVIGIPIMVIAGAAALLPY